MVAATPKGRAAAQHRAPRSTRNERRVGRQFAFLRIARSALSELSALGATTKRSERAILEKKKLDREN